jgi:hypothetical protein
MVKDVRKKEMERKRARWSAHLGSI